ncbi:MAG: lipoprotein [Shinella sp.]|nr:lipoprotein [Shinella sp.]
MHLRKTFLVFLVLCLSGSLLSACGRKGDLEVPGGVPITKQEREAAAKNNKQDVEDRPFVLDPLL